MDDALEKVCPLVLRDATAGLELLAFRHPLAGRQLVKGTIERGESPVAAARRELREESGLVTVAEPEPLLGPYVATDGRRWHLFVCTVAGVPGERWSRHVDDGGGLRFDFFWQPASVPLDDAWHPLFHALWRTLLPALFAVRALAPNVDDR